MGFKISVLNFKGTSFESHYFERDEVMVGRHTGNDLVLKDQDISRQHVSIFIRDGEFFLEDLKSMNGTRILENENWTLIKERTKLKLPSIMILGVNHLVKVEYLEDENRDHIERTRAFESPTEVTEPIFKKGNQEAIFVLDLCDSTKITNINEKLAYQLKVKLNQISMPILFLSDLAFYKGTGDGFLATFTSAKDALSSSLAVVARLAQWNKNNKSNQINYRIALHYGSTYHTNYEKKDIHGNDINIAFRIESLNMDAFIKKNYHFPNTNRILCSKSFYENVKDSIMVFSSTFAYCGQAELKGIKEPLEIYNIS
ncbi:FHA domain-containing protein [Candidatus Dependentiae bacterium]|nr:FHA domain-containing protein [Candidatus Dependentiae bacterium]